MSTANKIFIKLFRILLLSLVMMSVVQASYAKMPKAGLPIGTKATITYRDASNILQTRESDIVLTTIAQVYEVEVTAMRDPAHAEKGESADIPFQVKNVGNGRDDVTFSVDTFPSLVDKITFFSADAGGAIQPETGVESKAGNRTPFTLRDLDAGAQRYFVLRMPVPGSARDNDTLSAKLNVSTKGGRSSDISANTRVIGSRPFSVVPVGASKLNNKKETWVTFRVNGGLTKKSGYFQMWAVNSLNVSKPLKFKVKDRASFGGNVLLPGELDKTDETLFKVKHDVGANNSYLIRMPITIDDAQRGDEIVMFVKYGEADSVAIKPRGGDDSLEKSTGFVIRYDHVERSPDLEAVGNSKPGASSDYTRIDQALSGEVVDFDLLLHNRSTFADTFTIEELTDSKGALIAKVTPMDEKGIDAIEIGTRGLPELGPVPAGGEIRFKISVQLSDGRTSEEAQNIRFWFKAVDARTVEQVTQVLTIARVVSASGPTVKFSNTDDMDIDVERLVLDDGSDIKRFYMSVNNSDVTDLSSHQYQMQFVDKGFSIKPLVDQICGSPITNSGPIGPDGQVFCVDADLKGKSFLKSKVVIKDSIRSAETTAGIEILKTPLIEFASTGYDSNGVPGGDAELTVRVINRGGDMIENDYQLWHDTKDSTALTRAWKTGFSYDEGDWRSSLKLSGLKSGDSKDVFIKITIPQDAATDRTWSVTLGLREIGDKDSKATAVVTLALDDSGLIVIKEVSVLKLTDPIDCANSPVPRKFSKVTNAKVADGDCIWYRISVTNPPGTALIHDVRIVDPIPEHSSYANGAQINIPEATPSMDAEQIVTKGVDLASDKSLILTYPVTVTFQR